jgi:hypothetical protein
MGIEMTSLDGIKQKEYEETSSELLSTVEQAAQNKTSQSQIRLAWHGYSRASRWD